MTDKTHSDVDRALAAFGSGTIKYRSFGAPALRPSASRPTEAEAIRPTALDDADPFGAATATPRPTARDSTAAAKLFPLLGAAVPESASVQVHESSRSGTFLPDAPNDGAFKPDSGFDVPRGRFAPPPAPNYQVQGDEEPDYTEIGYIPPETRRPPPGAAYYTPAQQLPGSSAAYAPAPAPVAPPTQPAIPPAAPSDAPAWALTPAEPAAIPAAALPRAVTPSAAPPARSAPRAEEPPPITSLAAHFPQSGIGPAGASIDAADRRSLAEMFRVLSDRADASVPRAAAFVGVRAEEPGLFRRL